jgi:hypothetical protein
MPDSGQAPIAEPQPPAQKERTLEALMAGSRAWLAAAGVTIFGHKAAQTSLSYAGWPYLAGSVAIGARLLWLVRDDAVLDGCVSELLALATEQGFPHLARAGSDLSRLGQGQKWRFHGGNVSAAKRLGRVSFRWGGALSTPLYGSAGRGM